MDGVKKAQVATKVLFGGDIRTVSGQEIVDAFENDGSRMVKLDRNTVVDSNLDLVATLAKATRSKCKNCEKETLYFFERHTYLF